MAVDKSATGGNDTASPNEKVEADEEFEIVDKPIAAAKDDDADDDDPKRVRKEDDDDGDEGPDGRLSAESEEEADRRRQSRRERREQQKQRRKDARERDASRIEQLERTIAERDRLWQERLSQVEASTGNIAVQSLDQQMRQFAAAYKQAQSRRAEAIRLGDDQAFTAAEQVMNEASQNWHSLDAQKKKLTPDPERQAEQPQRQDAPRVERLVREFLTDHPWIDVRGGDRDSRTALAIDKAMTAEGLNPASPDYYDEFEDRLQEALPHKFRTRNSNERRGPQVGSGREHVPSSTRKQVYVSPERKAAMMEAGQWDDPAERKKALKYYADFDRQNQAASR